MEVSPHCSFTPNLQKVYRDSNPRGVSSQAGFVFLRYPQTLLEIPIESHLFLQSLVFYLYTSGNSSPSGGGENGYFLKPDIGHSQRSQNEFYLRQQLDVILGESCSFDQGISDNVVMQMLSSIVVTCAGCCLNGYLCDLLGCQKSDCSLT